MPRRSPYTAGRLRRARPSRARPLARTESLLPSRVEWCVPHRRLHLALLSSSLLPSRLSAILAVPYSTFQPRLEPSRSPRSLGSRAPPLHLQSLRVVLPPRGDSPRLHPPEHRRRLLRPGRLPRPSRAAPALARPRRPGQDFFRKPSRLCVNLPKAWVSRFQDSSAEWFHDEPWIVNGKRSDEIYESVDRETG